MYCYLNYFSFENPKEEINDTDVINTLEELCVFMELLKQHNMTLIINQRLSLLQLNGKPLKEYIKNIAEQKKRSLLIVKFTNFSPFCSDITTHYDSDEDIMLKNCMEKVSKIDILENFLACALFDKSPIVTADKLCSKKQFFEQDLKIECDNNQNFIIDNFLLSNGSSAIESYVKKLNNEKYLQITNWDDYQDYVNQEFKYIEVLDGLVDDLQKYSFTSIQGRNVIEDIEKINIFIEKNKGNPKFANFKNLSKHINEENDDKLVKRKNKLTKKDKEGNSIIMSWHTRIGDYRLYFYFTDKKLYFNFFTSKIPE